MWGLLALELISLVVGSGDGAPYLHGDIDGVEDGAGVRDDGHDVEHDDVIDGAERDDAVHGVEH